MHVATRLPAAALLTLALMPGALRAQQVFQTSWIGYETGKHTTAERPYAMHLADFDGDGDVDVATVNYWFYPRLGVQLNNGDGTLAPPAYFNYALGSLGFVVADITGDGRPDVVVSNTGSNGEGKTVSLLRNLGNGTFATQKQFTVGSGAFVGPVGLAAADFDGDGRIDVAAALYGFNGAGSQVALLRNDGGGGFQPAQPLAAGAAPYALAAGDLDGDGRPDLVVARGQQKLSVLHNTGAGFAPAVSYDVLGFFNADIYQSLALGDVDRDGDLDVLYSSSNTSVNFEAAIALLRNGGDGTLGAAEALFTGAESSGASALAVADVSGDGWPDVLGAIDSRWCVMPGDGSGGFLPVQAFGATESPFGIEAADLDGDGDLDPVVMGRDSLELAVYLNPGHGEFTTPQPVAAVNAASVPSTARGTAAADIDGDGDLDLAIAYSLVTFNGGGISILRNLGGGSFAAPVQYPAPKDAIHVKLADLNGDGAADLLWADDAPPYDVETRTNTGGGNFGPIVNWPMNTCGNGEVGALDLDDDGDLDIALCEYAGCPSNLQSGQRVFLRRNNGDGTFQPPYIQIVSGFPERVRGADVNGDGRTDLLVTGNSWIDVCLGLGNGIFAAPIPAACDWGPKGFCVADLDGDGALDMATTNYGDLGSGSESISVLRGLGNGSFAPPATLSASFSSTYGNSRDIVAGDADGDGDLDLMAGNWGSRDVSFYRNLGAGSFAPQVRYGTGWNTIDLAFGDFTGDGRGDLAALTSGGTSLGFKPALVLLRGGVPVPAWKGLGHALAGSFGLPALTASGTLQGGSPLALQLENAATLSVAHLVVGLGQANLPFKGGLLAPSPDVILALPTGASGSIALATTWPSGVPPGLSFAVQAWIEDPLGPQGFAASNGLLGTTP